VTCVLDVSTAVAALIGRGPERDWALDLVLSQELAAPHFMLAEAANQLRRASLLRRVPDEQAGLAFRELLVMPVTLYAFVDYGQRVWQLRNTVTAYDAWYVALAEDLGVPMATIDNRLIRSPGPRCPFLTFEP
jgi:predicted nucleic acid-binding protein